MSDEVKKFEEFVAPWETEAGNDAEIDKPKLKRHIHNLMLDRAKARKASEEASASLETATKERDEALAEAAKASPDESNKKIERLEKQVASLTSERDKLVADNEYAELRKEVLGDLPEKYAKYVTGDSREDLEKSLESVREDFGLDDNADEDDEEEDDDDLIVDTRPKSRLANSADRTSRAKPDEVVDFDAVADQIIGGGIFR